MTSRRKAARAAENGAVGSRPKTALEVFPRACSIELTAASATNSDANTSLARGRFFLRGAIMPAQEVAVCPERWARHTCGRCGALLVFRFAGTQARPVWELFRPDDPDGKPTKLPDKRCYQCHRSFASMTAAEVRDRFWPGGLAQ